MSHIADILTAFKSSLADQTSFLTADIYKREPLLEDYDRSKVNIFIYPDTVDPDEQPFVVDFRIYKISVVVKFRVDGRGNSASATDTVTVNKGAYIDDIFSAAKDCLPTGIHPISNCYQVDPAGLNVKFDEETPNYDDQTGNEYGLKQVYSFFTYENTDYLMTEAVSYLLTESGEQIIAG